MELNKIKAMAEDLQDYIVAMRRYFHEHPEVSDKEFNTSKRLIEEIEAMGLPYEHVPGTGFIVTLKGGLPGKNKVLRSDIDALPIQEAPENLKQPKACVSLVPGVMHACGHDAHMAMLLAAIKILVKIRDQVPGTVYCCFEEGEEVKGGVFAILKALEKYHIGEVFALHVYNNLAAGKVNIVPGPRMAGAIRIGFEIRGKSGHGSRPDQAVNPLIPMAHILAQLDSAYNNKLDVEKKGTLAICRVDGGTANNIIPDSVYVGGTSRFYDVEQRDKAFTLINKIAENTAASFGCHIVYTKRHGLGSAPVVNNPEVVKEITAKLTEICGPDVLADCDKWYASEGFYEYLKRYPGALGFVGIRNEQMGCGAAHHNERFDMDESGLYLGTLSEVAFVLG